MTEAAVRYVVGYSADSGGRAAVAAARLFATEGVGLLVCTIIPATWGVPSMAAIDAEYGKFLNEHAAAALREAGTILGDDVAAEFQARAARTAAEGILDLVAEVDAPLLILGSARGSPLGRFALGSVTERLVHTAPIPVALAPRGYRPARLTRVRRVSCGYSAHLHSARTVAAAGELARRHGVPLRLVTGYVRDRQMYPSLVGYDAERQVEQEWRADAEEQQRKAVADLPDDVRVETALVKGEDWEEALDSLHWEDGEVLVVGSSRRGIGQVFLGTNASKIARSAPVPTVLVPAPARGD